MLIYTCIMIPILAVIFLSWKFPKRMTIGERVLVFVVPVIAVIIAKYVSVTTLTTDTEYWNSLGQTAIYYEYYETYVHETCYREHCTGSGKNRTCTQVPYDCSHCDRFHAHWELIDNIGKRYEITQGHYRQLVKRWNNQTFKDMNRSISRHGLCGQDGDAYVTNFPGDFELTEPICKQHKYENKVQCSKSVFNYEPVDSEIVKEFGLYRYPHYEAMGIFNYNPIIGVKNPGAAQRLSFHNAHLGPVKQVHMMVVVFHDKSIEAADWQEAHWGNGNKNEFILCIGERDEKVDWARVISWTEVEDLKISVAQKAQDLGKEKMDLIPIIDMMAEEVRKNYVRKQFADFSYIKVEPTTKAIFFTFLITIIVTIGVSLFAIYNPWERDPGYRTYRRFRS